jgi:AraC family transcriptional regulator
MIKRRRREQSTAPGPFHRADMRRSTAYLDDGAIDRVIFASDLVRVGEFRCHPDHPSFRDSGPTENSCFVFSRTAVEIQTSQGAAFVANPNGVTFHNPGQPYQRRVVDGMGDLCDWFGVNLEVARDAVRAINPSVDDRPECPFPTPNGQSDSSTYLLQRKLFLHIIAGRITDPLTIEESVISLLERVIRSSLPHHRAPDRRNESPRQREMVRHAEAILSRSPGERVTLQAIADELGASAFHVCRLFHRVTGTPLHRYRLRYRLRTALEAVTESARAITDIALDAEFSSHSHFTEAFKREFGVAPSGVRNNLIAQHLAATVLLGREPK